MMRGAWCVVTDHIYGLMELYLRHNQGWCGGIEEGGGEEKDGATI